MFSNILLTLLKSAFIIDIWLCYYNDTGIILLTRWLLLFNETHSRFPSDTASSVRSRCDAAVSCTQRCVLYTAATEVDIGQNLTARNNGRLNFHDKK